MSNRQRNYTPTIADSWYDTMLDILKKHYKIEKHSELITRIVIESAQKVKTEL